MQPKTIMEKNCKGPSINDVGNWEGEGVKNWSKLPTDSTKKLPTWGREGGVKNPENCRRRLWMVQKRKLNKTEKAFSPKGFQSKSNQRL
jgi:hypothetical protein